VKQCNEAVRRTYLRFDIAFETSDSFSRGTTI